MLSRDELKPLPGHEAPALVLEPLRNWRTLGVLASVGSLVMLFGAGSVLSDGGLGRAAANRGCDGNLLAGLLLLALAGGLTGMARIVVDRRFVHELVFDTWRLLAVLPAPVLALALSAPGFMGCSFAVGIADWGVVGEALLGTPGMTIAGASAFAVGAGLTAVVRVRVPLATLIEEYERLHEADADVAERALREHNLYEEGSTLAGPLGDPMRLVDSSELLSRPPGGEDDPGALPPE